MSTIKTNNITLMEEVETEEAEKIFETHKKKYIYFIVIPFLLFIASYVMVAINSQNIDILPKIVALPGFLLFLTVLGLIIYATKMKPYRKLLKLAELNDRIRHEERIRYKERIRLESGVKTEFKTEDIEKTFIKTEKQD